VLKGPPDSPSLASLLKALGDPTRLRILGLLGGHELSVGELCRSLGLSQSRVSNHLRVIREYALLTERHVGPSTFLYFDAAGLEAGGGFMGELWATLVPEVRKQREHGDDLARLRGVLEERRQNTKNFFDSVAGEWNAIGVDFATGQARQRVAANFVDPQLTVADLGCGTGYVAQAFLGLCSRVICVDSSTGMLEEARKRLDETPVGTRIEYRPGELDSLPLSDGEVDGAVCAMVLHHLESPDACLAEMFRIIRPGGTAVLLELSPHRQEWMHEALGDRHLGLDPQLVAQSLESAGFVEVALEIAADRYQPGQAERAEREEGLPLYIIRGRVPR
jgi:ubiquinone/menaquinone biosynthesis C-methylase UbiE/DNA-binding transcriptional ArsR family regulator